MKTFRNLYPKICDWDNLVSAYYKARRGKRRHPSVATFELNQEEELITLLDALNQKTYQPGAYHSFYIHEPKRRLISAAPFRDRVVHHALCNIIEPLFDRTFIDDSYANRIGKGTHRAIARAQKYSQRFDYVLQLDIEQFFPSIDHTILRAILARKIKDQETMWLIDQIINSGRGLLTEQYQMRWFPQDDLFALARPRGLPIGNLTSQFWANCFLNPIDHFIKRELKCKGYVRYVDDMLLFGDSKADLWSQKDQLEQKFATQRLTIHQGAHPKPTTEGIPFLGFVIYPTHKRLKRRKVIHFRRRLKKIRADYEAGVLSIDDVSASIRGWINHVSYGNTYQLREAILSDFTV